MVVFEGVDATGKSTLANYVSRVLDIPIQGSEGPPKSEGEMELRVKGYFSRYPRGCPIIFDRHPCISQPIYGNLRETHLDPIPSYLIREFYSRNYFIVYCDPLNRGLVDHVVKKGEDPSHVKAVVEGYTTLLLHYRMWAIQHAHLMYRIGDDQQRVLDLCSTILRKHASPTNETQLFLGS